MDAPYPALLADLAAEHATVDDLLARAPAERWRTPTPAAGWDVADSMWHLLTAERAALVSLAEDQDWLAEHPRHEIGPRPEVEPAELLVQWRAARSATLDAFARRDGSARVPWGGRRMSVRSLATARLMETWAHGLDCFAALNVQPVDTDRLIHVAWLGWRSLPYAFAVSGLRPAAPPESLRLELRAPSGVTWMLGPDDCSARVRGDAGVWCRVVTHRWRDPTPPPLEGEGVLAEQAVAIAQAFL
jgi:uncharacterized protein (TIGR03084 family)